MLEKQNLKSFNSIGILAVIVSLYGCSTTTWTHPDPAKDWKHDLSECTYNTMSNVCSNTGASVATNCSTSNGVTTCRPAVIPASNACHDEIQLSARDTCLQQLGWIKNSH
jgi:hypothetical protein